MFNACGKVKDKGSAGVENDLRADQWRERVDRGALPGGLAHEDTVLRAGKAQRAGGVMLEAGIGDARMGRTSSP